MNEFVISYICEGTTSPHWVLRLKNWNEEIDVLVCSGTRKEVLDHLASEMEVEEDPNPATAEVIFRR